MSGVVCSYQGAFAPPHLGHRGGARILAEALLSLYSGQPIEVLFMPTNDLASKTSLSKAKALAVNNSNASPSEYVSQDERKGMLQLYCDELNAEFKGSGLSFGVSDIEYELGKEGKKATIHTLLRLQGVYPKSLLVLGIGRDNCAQLPWWESVAKYAELVDSVLVLDREGFSLSPDNSYDTGVTYRDSSVKIEFENNAPWSTTLNGVKKGWTAAELFAEDPSTPQKTELKHGIEALLHKMILLEAPDAISSSEVRALLAQGQDVSPLVGPAVAGYLEAHGIGVRPKASLKAELQKGGRRKTRGKGRKPRRRLTKRKRMPKN